MMLSVFREDGLCLVKEADWAANAWRRTRGLIGLRRLEPGAGLVIAPCRAIHTCFMRFALDIVFFSREGFILRMVPGVQPFKFAWGGWSAWGVLEMESGWFPWSSIKEGDRLLFKKQLPLCP